MLTMTKGSSIDKMVCGWEQKWEGGEKSMECTTVIIDPISMLKYHASIVAVVVYCNKQTNKETKNNE
jgi:hypothetical protein